jgi:7,8-dihydropterin-6-yl-methyl-4-(beta-D-ribofuranosyl)aminobenzene 5'-phosphate synthase
MMTRVSILCENSVAEPYGIIGEHGFSAFVETADLNFLFDTGQGKVLMNNCFVMDKNLSSIKFLVLSHGHYDHTLGLPDVLLKKNPLDVYCHPDVFAKRYWAYDDSKSKFVGIPFRREYLESLGANFKFVREFMELGKGIYLSGEVPRNIPPEFDDHMEIFDKNGQRIKDPLWDDFTIAIDTKKGLVILLGCAHAGLINILQHIIEKTGKDRIFAVIGGTHLGFSTKAQIEEAVEILEQYQIQKIGVSHCTGLQVSGFLSNHFADRFFYASAGAVFEI